MSAEYDLQHISDSPIYNNDTEFDSTCLFECLEHFKHTDDIDPLETAISINWDKKNKAFEKVNMLLERFKSTEHNTSAIYQLTEIKNLLR